MDSKKAPSLSEESKKVEIFYYIAEALRNDPSISLVGLCKSFNVSKSGYYAWKSRRPSDRDNADLKLIKSIFESKAQKAGIRTIRMILLRKHKVNMNLKKIARIKKKYGLKTIIRTPRWKRYIAKGGEEHIASPNVVNRQFNATKTNQVYSTDITYLHYGNNQRAYLSVVKDLASKEIVHYHLSNHIHMELVTYGLDELFRKINPKDRKNLIMHSDQGSHYTVNGYRELLKRFSITQSMSRKGNCLDNAPIESFFGHLKDEVEIRNCKTYLELKNKIENYINYYNNERPQWGLLQKTPVEYRHLLE